jgi:hypothetical protein
VLVAAARSSHIPFAPVKTYTMVSPRTSRAPRFLPPT